MKTTLTKQEKNSIQNLNDYVYDGMYEWNEIVKKRVLDTIVIYFEDEKWVLVNDEPKEIINKCLYDTWYCYDIQKWWIRDYYSEAKSINRQETIEKLGI